jgi:alanine dehydrogenase
MIKAGQLVFTYFHFSASEELTRGMIATGATAIAYETVEARDRSLPLLTPMSEVAGRMSVQEGAKYLTKSEGGRGVLLGGVPGVEPAHVLVVGGGVVGVQAAKMAAGLGAIVYILDISPARLRELDNIMPSNVITVISNNYTISDLLKRCDLVIGAVLLPGARAPRLIRKEHLPTMPRGSVIVDVAVDQGGICETTRPTTHDNPTFVVDGVVHYCVANMPGAVARTSTIALTNSTLPYVMRLANQGLKRSFEADPGLALGLNVIDGKVTYRPVAEAFDLAYTDPKSLAL